MAPKGTTSGYHDYAHEVEVAKYTAGQWDTRFTFTFENFFHPRVGELIAKLNSTGSLSGLMDPGWQNTLTEDFFESLYAPAQNNLTRVVFSPKEIDVSEHGPYANYNWELFFHIPFTIAVHLSKTQRFAEAQRWFHYVFDPTSNDQTVDPPKRPWRFRAFRRDDDPKQIDQLIALMSTPPSELSEPDKLERQNVLDGYQAILDKPFRPHAVARTRHVAYQYAVVMKYLDNLIAWGDHLFQQDTVESINEATMRYVLAANLLGPRPQRIPERGTVQPKTFAQLKALPHDPMGNAMVELEGQLPFNLGAASPGGVPGDGSGAGPLFGIGYTLYFCVPHNEKLLGYWDMVADRLFKIRHCMNIEGVVRPLALFDPPIDPGMLIKAAAAGLDIGGVVSGLTQPIGPVRSLFLIQKAIELCGEVRALGAALLSALEKSDAEHLALVRQGHEIQLQQMVQDVRFLQWKAAEEATKSLLVNRASSLERLHYYQRLLGLPADQNAPDAVSLDHRVLTEENFDEAFAALVGNYDKQIGRQPYPRRALVGAGAPQQQSGASGSGRMYLSSNENADLNVHMPSARDFRIASVASDGASQGLALMPDFGVNIHFWGMGGNSKIIGGSTFAAVARIVASALTTNASDQESRGSSASKTATYEQRGDDWLLQYNLAAHELMQNGRQILTSLIAEQVAHHEYLNVQQQIGNAQEVDQLLHEKFTNAELYVWMQGEISRLYYEYYRLAFDAARRAERSMKRELMRPELDAQDFVKFNYWDGGRKGLLSGEGLHLDVKRMELAYHDNNKRELELTKHVSVRQLDPFALLTMRATGSCQVSIPEWLYDRDCQGHYMRRIKSVSVSMPSVVGPYTSVNCTLSLLNSSVRVSPIPGDGYARQGAEDSRFVNFAGAVQSIVTSVASNDAGLFETNFRDERFLPFEGAGAVSTWKLDLPKHYAAFDYGTLSDVILHIRYTARAGVPDAAVKTVLDEQFEQVGSSGLALLFSLRHDFPTEWSAFVNGAGDLAVTIPRDYFPYFTEGKTLAIDNFEVVAEDLAHHGAGDAGAATAELDAESHCTFTVGSDAPGPTQVMVRDSSVDVALIVHYHLE